MFPRTNFTNPYQSFAFGAPQYGAWGGVGGINPLVSQMVNPYASIPMAVSTGIGVNPYVNPYVSPYIGPYSGLQASVLGQISPFMTQTPSLGQIQPVHPLQVAQLAATNPTILPLMAQHSTIGQSPYSVQPLLQYQPGQIGLPFQQFGAGIGQWGSPFSLGPQPLAQQAFGYPGSQQGFGWSVPTLFSNPAQGVDLITGAVISQQSSPLAQSQLPIRPLISSPQPDPFQLAALSGLTTGQVTDPFSVMAPTGLMTPLGVTPIHLASRQQNGTPQIGLQWTPPTGIPC